MTAQGWMPIETVELGDFRMLLWDDVDRYIYIGRFMPDWGDTGLFAEDSGGLISGVSIQPTHWQPLPPPPTA